MSAVAELAHSAEVAAGLGHNQPPEPTPFEAVKIHIEDLWVEAKNWADGTPVANQAQADEVSRLIEEFRLAHVAADNARKTENEVFDKGKAAVQEKYAPLIADTKAVTGLTVKAQAALKAALKPFLGAEAAKLRATQEAARLEAERAAAAAAEAMRAAAPDNLDAREEAEALVEQARLAASAASRAEHDRAQAHGGSRALGLRKTWTAVLADRKVALLHYLVAQPAEFEALLQRLADMDVREGKRTIPGFNVVEGTKL